IEQKKLYKPHAHICPVRGEKGCITKQNSRLYDIPEQSSGVFNPSRNKDKGISLLNIMSNTANTIQFFEIYIKKSKNPIFTKSFLNQVKSIENKIAA
ncbi:MAG: hypothetical protein Q8Q35_00620, partial [Nanoarchaeota archaeon]|nr:hypothetical protein [Nanoarchaeota archaeon]